MLDGNFSTPPSLAFRLFPFQMAVAAGWLTASKIVQRIEEECLSWRGTQVLICNTTGFTPYTVTVCLPRGILAAPQAQP